MLVLVHFSCHPWSQTQRINTFPVWLICSFKCENQLNCRCLLENVLCSYNRFVNTSLLFHWHGSMFRNNVLQFRSVLLFVKKVCHLTY
jgi:hypothetical protein